MVWTHSKPSFTLYCHPIQFQDININCDTVTEETNFNEVKECRRKTCPHIETNFKNPHPQGLDYQNALNIRPLCVQQVQEPSTTEGEKLDS